MLNPLSVALAVVAIVCAALALFPGKARAGVYTTTITRADGTVVICTTVTDFYGNPIAINCTGE